MFLTSVVNPLKRRPYLFALCAALFAASGAVWLAGHDRYAGRMGVAQSASPPGNASGVAAIASTVTRAGGAGKKTGRQAPLPPSEAPVKDIFSELQARANAGDKAAATRLYRDLNHCNRLRSTNRDYSHMTDEMLGEDPGAMDAEQLENYQAQLDAIEVNRHVLGQMQEKCNGVSDAMFSSLVPSIQRAAELGDADARACYLSRGPAYDMRNSIGHPEMFEAYRESVRPMIDAGLAAGDWKVVDILSDAYQPGSESLLGAVLGSDAFQYYRYLKLYSVGARQSHDDKLERQLTLASADLTPSQVAEADAWAQESFRNFDDDSTGSSVAGGDTCSFPAQ